MVVEIKAWLFGVISVLLLALLVTTGILIYNNQQMKDDLAKKEQTIEAYKRNKEDKVKEAADTFLKAFLEMDSTKDKTTAERIKPYITSEALHKVAPAGLKGNVSKIKITSSLSNTRLYYTATAPDKASIFAKTTRAIRIKDGEPTTSTEMMELEMKLIDQKWIVSDVQLISQQNESVGGA
jgi:hypothetical protein